MSPENPTVSRQKQLRKIVGRTLLILFGLLVFLLVLFMIFSPGIAKNYLNKHGEELSGRKLQIDKIKVNYFTSSVQILGAHMFEQHDSTEFVGFDSLLVNLKPLRLLKNELHVQQFRVVNLRAQLTQNDTVFNFSDLIKFYSGSEESTDTTMSEPLILDLNQLEIKNCSVVYTDQQINHSIQMKNVSFLIPRIYWGGAEESQADISFNLGTGGNLSSSFDYQTETGDYSGVAEIGNLNLKIILPYLQQYMKFSDISGKFSAKINFNGNYSGFDSFTLNGEAGIDSLSVFDMQGKKVLGAAHAEVDLKNIVPLHYRVQLDSFIIHEPYTYLALEDSLFNFEKMIIDQPAESIEDTTSEEDSPYDVTINHFKIDNGLIDFSDQRFRETFDYELSKVEVDMDSISLNSKWLNIRSSMKLNKRGNLEASLGINPTDPFNHIELEYVLSDFQLPDINIYSKHYIGLPILFGDMYYTNKTTIINRQLISKNELVIRNVELGRKTGGLYDIPIKLALFILKDVNGDINLDIPVTGDLSDPKTRIGKIVWNTFKGFMVKIVSSPFKALGNLLGAEPDELEEIAFDYADTTLVRKQERSLDLLLKLEEMKPGMLIEMQYLNDRKLERSDAAGQIMQAEYESVHHKQASSHRADYLNFLQTKSGQDSLVVQDYELLLAPVAEVDSTILEREQQRIELVKQYLHSANDSTHIRVLGYNKDDVMNIGSRPRFTIKYSLAEDSEIADSKPNKTN